MKMKPEELIKLLEMNQQRQQQQPQIPRPPFPLFDNQSFNVLSASSTPINNRFLFMTPSPTTTTPRSTFSSTLAASPIVNNNDSNSRIPFDVWQHRSNNNYFIPSLNHNQQQQQQQPKQHSTTNVLLSQQIFHKNGILPSPPQQPSSSSVTMNLSKNNSFHSINQSSPTTLLSTPSSSSSKYRLTNHHPTNFNINNEIINQTKPPTMQQSKFDDLNNSNIELNSPRKLLENSNNNHNNNNNCENNWRKLNVNDLFDMSKMKNCIDSTTKSPPMIADHRLLSFFVENSNLHNIDGDRNVETNPNNNGRYDKLFQSILMNQNQQYNNQQKDSKQKITILSRKIDDENIDRRSDDNESDNNNINKNNNNKNIRSNDSVADQKLKRLKLNRMDEKHLENILNKFCHDLLETDYRIERLIISYTQRTCSYIFSIIFIYMEHLDERLKLFNNGGGDDDNKLSFTDLLDGRQYQYNDFFSYGQRFLYFLKYCKWFTLNEQRYFKTLYDKYLSIHPINIVEFRKHLLQLKLTLYRNNFHNNNKQNRQMNCPIDYRSITYEKFNHRELYDKIIDLNNFDEKFNEFDRKYSLSNESKNHLMKFVELFEEILMKNFQKFRPRVHTFGSISNGLGTSNSDFDLFIEFQNLSVDKLDYHTSMLTLEVIEKLMKIEFGLQIRDDHSTIIHSRRCPIIKLNFRQCLRYLQSQIPSEKQSTIEFTKCDISLVSMFGVQNSRLLNFYTKYDYRFYQLTMLLKYWAKTNNLISMHMFSTYAFTMLVVYFLQQQTPAILPTIEHLNKMAKLFHRKKRQQHLMKQFLIDRWDFNFCDDIDFLKQNNRNNHRLNTKSTAKLLVEFFRFYNDFNFYLYAIRPRKGEMVNKFDLSLEKLEKQLKNFNMTSFFCIEDPFVLDHNIAYNVRTRNVHKFFYCIKNINNRINERNCIDILLEESLTMIAEPDLFPPCNFFRYQLNVTDSYNNDNDNSNNKYELIDRINKLQTSNDIDKQWQYLMIFFKHIIEILFEKYFFMKNYQIKISKNRKIIQCYPQWNILNYMIAICDKNNERIQLQQYIQNKTPGSIDLLRNFRKRLRKEMKKFIENIANNTNDNNDNDEEWFNLSYSYMKNDANYFASFDVDSTKTSTYLILDLIVSTLQIFLHSIDRQEPIDVFSQCYNTFLLKNS